MIRGEKNVMEITTLVKSVDKVRHLHILQTDMH